MSGQGPTRREVLVRGAALASAGAAWAAGVLPGLPGPHPALAQQPGRRTQRVVLVRFGGGVRFGETFGHADPKSVVPNLVSASQRGVLYTNMRNNGRLDHVGATAQILCGQSWPAEAKLGARPPQPTIFEYYRKATQAPAHRCLMLDPGWHAAPLDYSSAEGYGAGFGGTLLQTRRIGVAQMRFVQDAVMNPKEQVWRDAEALRTALLEEDFERAEQVDPMAADPTPSDPQSVIAKLRADAFDREKVPQKLGKSKIRSADGLSVFLAHMAIKSKVDPAILALNLHGPDVAHRGSHADYLEAIRTLDGWLGEFLEILEKEKWLAGSGIIITPDVGRDLSGTGGGPSTHHAGDLGCRRLFAVVLAPGLKPALVDRTVSQADLCPTMGAWLGVPTPEVGTGRAPLPEVA